MKITKREMVETDVTSDILCNKCGKSCKKDTGFYGLVEANVQGGYDSDHLSDGLEYTFSLCEECLNELFKSFKINVEVKDAPILP